MTFDGVAPAEAQSLNITVTCSEPPETTSTSDWFVLQVGHRALEMDRPPDPLRVMAGNAISFNASSVLPLATINGRQATADDGVSASVVSVEIDWLKNASSSFVDGSPPMSLSNGTDQQMALSLVMSDQDNDTFISTLPLVVWPTFFAEPRLPPLRIDPSDNISFDLQPYIRGSSTNDLVVSMNINNTAVRGISGWLTFNQTTLTLSGKAVARQFTEKYMANDLGKVHESDATPDVIFTVYDPSSNLSSSTTMQILMQNEDHGIVIHDQTAHSTVFLAMVVLCSALILVGLIVAVVWLWNRTRSPRAERSRKTTSTAVEPMTNRSEKPDVVDDCKSKREILSTRSGTPNEDSVAGAVEWFTTDSEGQQPSLSYVSSSTGDGSSLGPSGQRMSIRLVDPTGPASRPSPSAHRGSLGSVANLALRGRGDQRVKAVTKEESVDSSLPASSSGSYIPRRHPLMSEFSAQKKRHQADQENSGTRTSPRNYTLPSHFANSSSSLDTAKDDEISFIQDGHPERFLVAGGTNPQWKRPARATGAEDENEKQMTPDLGMLSLGSEEVSRALSTLPSTKLSSNFRSILAPPQLDEELFEEMRRSHSLQFDQPVVGEFSFRSPVNGTTDELVSWGLRQSPESSVMGCQDVDQAVYRSRFFSSSPSQGAQDSVERPATTGSNGSLDPDDWPLVPMAPDKSKTNRATHYVTSYTRGPSPERRSFYASTHSNSRNPTSSNSEVSKEFIPKPRWDYSLHSLPDPSPADDANAGNKSTDRPPSETRTTDYPPTVHLPDPPSPVLEDLPRWEY
ncbi:hypothetical protein FRB99_005990 [Tulasnella sp. 403]|nr:hypothetical protein FRB99_005990 [Tulasnella sp. 403]